MESFNRSKVCLNNLSKENYQLTIMAFLTIYPDFENAGTSEMVLENPIYSQVWVIVIATIFFITMIYGICAFVRRTKDREMLKNSLDKKDILIAQSENQFRIVWDNSQDGMILSVLGGAVIAANPSICKLANVSEDELIAKGLKSLFLDTDFYEMVRDDIAKDLQSNTNNTFVREMRMPLKSGDKEIEVSISRMNQNFEGNVLFLNVFRDISEKKAYEKGLKIAKDKAEEISCLKSNIISNMSHEIRTPLNGILGSTEYVIQTRSDDKELLEHLNIIRESGERLLQTITNFLDLSALEADELKILLEKTNVNDFISKILINHKSIGIKKGILVTSKFLTKPFYANIERNYLQIIVNNIVGNSVKYSEKGLIQVEVQNIKSQLVIKVHDQGIGISKDYLEKLFYPFEQESKGFNRKFEGSGLGLAITKHLVEKLNGQIEVESEKGNGTLVRILIPLSI